MHDIHLICSLTNQIFHLIESLNKKHDLNLKGRGDDFRYYQI